MIKSYYVVDEKKVCELLEILEKRGDEVLHVTANNSAIAGYTVFYKENIKN